jgi:hypothetical protein
MLRRRRPAWRELGGPPIRVNSSSHPAAWSAACAASPGSDRGASPISAEVAAEASSSGKRARDLVLQLIIRPAMARAHVAGGLETAVQGLARGRGGANGAGAEGSGDGVGKGALARAGREGRGHGLSGGVARGLDGNEVSKCKFRRCRTRVKK